MPVSLQRVASNVSLPIGTILTPLMMFPSPLRHHAAVLYPGSNDPSQTARRSPFFRDETIADKSSLTILF